MKTSNGFWSNLTATIVGGLVLAAITATKPNAWQMLAGFGLIGLGAVLYLIYCHYDAVLGCGHCRKETVERQAYDTLKRHMKDGGLPVVVYAAGLKKFLIWLDVFFGDRVKPTVEQRATGEEPAATPNTRFSYAFGLREAAPLWTAPSLDRCLLLALIYPIATIFLGWVASGDVGPAERALDFYEGVSLWRRLICLVLIGMESFFLFKYKKVKD